MQLAGAVQLGVYQVETLKIVQGISVRSNAAWDASSTEINPFVRCIHSSRYGYETNSSSADSKMYTQYWKTASERPAQERCSGYWPSLYDLICLPWTQSNKSHKEK